MNLENYSFRVEGWSWCYVVIWWLFGSLWSQKSSPESPRILSCSFNRTHSLVPVPHPKARPLSTVSQTVSWKGYRCSALESYFAREFQGSHTSSFVVRIVMSKLFFKVLMSLNMLKIKTFGIRVPKVWTRHKVNKFNWTEFSFYVIQINHCSSACDSCRDTHNKDLLNKWLLILVQWLWFP